MLKPILKLNRLSAKTKPSFHPSHLSYVSQLFKRCGRNKRKKSTEAENQRSGIKTSSRKKVTNTK